MKEFRVAELFAGVGGFRVGLERADKDFFNFVWSNQFEPSTKIQHASRTYIRVFGEDNHVNEDIAKVDVKDIPDCDMLVGGFPCQDYSVANILSRSQGIVGKKGVLWWEIYRILNEKTNKPKVLFFENVDRLIQSPATQRGRDFAIILSSLNKLGYWVEWRIINAADYGMPQRRKRTYILAFHKDFWRVHSQNDLFRETTYLTQGILGNAFPFKKDDINCIKHTHISDDVAYTSEYFGKDTTKGWFENSGIMFTDGKCITAKVTPDYNGPRVTLGDIILKEDDQFRSTVTEDYYLSEDDVKKWEYSKGYKRIEKINKQGLAYVYSEGAMSFPDPLDKPSRTIITSEMTKSPNRFTHVIKDPVNGRYRRLVPVELERLNMFPDNHTAGETDNKRGFFMGNALVCGVIEKVGENIKKMFANSK